MVLPQGPMIKLICKRLGCSSVVERLPSRPMPWV